MRPETLAALYDVRSAVEEILRLVPVPSEFGADRTVGLAVERLFLIVGEAMVRIRSFEEPVYLGFPEGPSVIAMRNIIVTTNYHAYRCQCTCMR
jgi:uncharacterized protein with HEPN domain